MTDFKNIDPLLVEAIDQVEASWNRRVGATHHLRMRCRSLGGLVVGNMHPDDVAEVQLEGIAFDGTRIEENRTISFCMPSRKAVQLLVLSDTMQDDPWDGLYISLGSVKPGHRLSSGVSDVLPLFLVPGTEVAVDLSASNFRRPDAVTHMAMRYGRIAVNDMEFFRP
jgi:hypothetical protein